MSELADFIQSRQPDGRRLRRLVALLTGTPRDLATLVRESALPRQTVEDVLAIVADDLARGPGGVAIDPARAAAYRQRFGYDRLMRTELTDPLAARLSECSRFAADIADLVAGAPAARMELDHVPATPETVARRALWLDATFDLAGMTLLCVGDHDLTSLAVAQLCPDVTVIVIDIDERTLEFIDTAAAARGLDVRCFTGDLRFGLPSPAVGRADLVFTDPPYTPEGVSLFVARGLQGLANRDHGRVVVAYGFSERHPTLGFQVQAAVSRLGVVCEMMLPAFNRYDGAQAIGSASDLYVWRPTARAWRNLDRDTANPPASIYTHGTQSLEKVPAGLSAAGPVIGQVVADAGLAVRIVTGGDWRDLAASASHLRLGTLVSRGIPPNLAGPEPFALVADLSADPGGWLLRVLMAANADCVVALVPARHPDVRNAAGRDSITGLLRAKYELRFLPGHLVQGHVIVVATAVRNADLDPAERLAQWLLSRVHGKVGNVWREGLISIAWASDCGPLTKRDALAMVASQVADAYVLDVPLISLPRHRVRDVLAGLGKAALGSVR